MRYSCIFAVVCELSVGGEVSPLSRTLSSPSSPLQTPRCSDPNTGQSPPKLPGCWCPHDAETRRGADPVFPMPHPLGSHGSLARRQSRGLSLRRSADLEKPHPKTREDLEYVRCKALRGCCGKQRSRLQRYQRKSVRGVLVLELTKMSKQMGMLLTASFLVFSQP